MKTCPLKKLLVSDGLLLKNFQISLNKVRQKTVIPTRISIILETIILLRQNFSLKLAFKTAVGMSLISMVSMEIAMNATDYFLTGGAILTWWVVPIMLAVGFVTPWPYNYWRLKKFNEACH